MNYNHYVLDVEDNLKLDVTYENFSVEIKYKYKNVSLLLSMDRKTADKLSRQIDFALQDQALTKQDRGEK